ncbi:MAG TPA: hypothetical protein VFB19_19495 [Mycobacterium sp.]|nr:hypothetical protein [Mycobacterium sp.]
MFDTVGALLWAAINVLLGYLGGHPLANNAIAALAPSFGVALAVADVVEFIRWLRRRQDRT